MLRADLKMAPKFGTSGLRGLVSELTSELVADYVRAFLQACPTGTGLFVGRDLRPSSPDIAEMVIATARRAGLNVTDCGEVPTPALALAAMIGDAAAVMITGSHIPADRNGLKFYLPSGEISKRDEARIIAGLGGPHGDQEILEGGLKYSNPGMAWVERYIQAFGSTALTGLRIGVWSHSAVSRDLLLAALARLGAETLELGRSEEFIPVDTEAVSSWAREKITAWCGEYRLDALVSTDGDGDRPLLADATGRLIPGDILGQITARVVGAEAVVTPISSNSGVELSRCFRQVLRTRIGSPFVIDGMQTLGGRVVGYEANGGFLLGFDADLAAGRMKALATRDSLLPIVAPLSLAVMAGGLANVVANEPARFTVADRLESIPSETSQSLISGFEKDRDLLKRFFDAFDELPVDVDLTDGLRVTLASESAVHFRPSGNAPELRIYIEAGSVEVAEHLLSQTRQKLIGFLP